MHPRYACAGGHEEVVRVLLEAGAHVEDHNENGQQRRAARFRGDLDCGAQA